MTLAERVAIVTGGAQGIGRAIVETFAQAGATGVVIADPNSKEAEATAREMAVLHGACVLAVSADVSSPAQVDAMVQATLSRFGRIDILVNNAGVCPVATWEDSTLESWNRILAINLTGMYLCTRAVIPHMRARGYGRIVYISSEAAYVGSSGVDVAYGVSKAGAITLAKSVAKEFAADGIRANAVAPGPIDTPLAHTLGSDFWALSEQRTLLKRHGSPGEIADAVLFLVTDRCNFITGQVLRVNGGQDLT